MPTSISGAVAREGKEQCKHLALTFSNDYKISIGSHSLSRLIFAILFLFLLEENRIVYERFQLAGKLQQQSRGTPVGGINPYTLMARLGPVGLAHYETSSKLDPTTRSFAQGNKMWRSSRILVG